MPGLARRCENRRRVAKRAAIETGNIAGSMRLYDRLRGKLHCDEEMLAEIKQRLAIVYAEINPA